MAGRASVEQHFMHQAHVALEGALVGELSLANRALELLLLATFSPQVQIEAGLVHVGATAAVRAPEFLLIGSANNPEPAICNTRPHLWLAKLCIPSAVW